MSTSSFQADPNRQDSFENMDIETLKILHKHTYDRIMWYRNEIWRVATPIWTGFGAFLIAVLSTAIFLRKENITGLGLSLSIGTVIISILINTLFYNYVGRLYDSVDKLNNLMTYREIALSKRMKLFQTVPGFLEADHTYVQHRVFPGLDILFVISNIIMTSAIVGIIYFVVPWEAKSQIKSVASSVIESKENSTSTIEQVKTKNTKHNQLNPNNTLAK